MQKLSFYESKESGSVPELVPELDNVNLPRSESLRARRLGASPYAFSLSVANYCASEMVRVNGQRLHLRLENGDILSCEPRLKYISLSRIYAPQPRSSLVT